ncbi:MAG: non-hydrolyzing UDP-N-acetylglucosamine 2-epimerase [Syntrophales bacterium]
MKRKIKIISIVGARPNFMKISPIVDEIRRLNETGGDPEIHSVIVHTGQHYDREMSALFFDQLSIPEPDYNLGVGSMSHARQTAEIMMRIEPVFIQEKPDYVMVVGDVNSTIAAALVAKKMGIRVIHVEAGLRSFDMTMPEEINRMLTDAISDILFITERSAEKNLLREGVSPEKIHFVGNVMIDTLLKHREKAEGSNILRRLGLVETSGREGGAMYAVLTLHRPATVDDPRKLRQVLDAVSDLSQRMDIVFPVHPRTAERIESMGLRLGGRIILTGPLGYLDFIKAVSRAAMVLTDSGGIQEETTVMGVPCLTLRENTERPVTITEGTNRLVGLSRERIREEAMKIIEQGIPAGRIPERWDGMAAVRIIEIIMSDSVSPTP